LPAARAALQILRAPVERRVPPPPAAPPRGRRSGIVVARSVA